MTGAVGGEPTDWRGASRVPLVIFPQDGLPAQPRLTTNEYVAVTRTVKALAELQRTFSLVTNQVDGWNFLQEVDHAAAGMVDVLAPVLVGVEAVSQSQRSEAHDVYMGVRRANLSPRAAAAEFAVIVGRGLADLRHAPLHWDDVVAETNALAAVLDRLVAEVLPDPSVCPNGCGDEAICGANRALYRPTGHGLDRWVLGHHLYGLFHLHAATMVNQAGSALDDQDTDQAADALAQAAVYARGATAAMLHASAMPAGYYQAFVRPTMRPPATPFELGGSMNPDNARYRAAITHLLQRSRETYPELATSHYRLAEARANLLSADLLDAERHVIVAAMLVGDARSLLQDETSSDNAVGVLRHMRHERAALYCTLMRHGDYYAAAAPSVRNR